MGAGRMPKRNLFLRMIPHDTINTCKDTSVLLLTAETSIGEGAHQNALSDEIIAKIFVDNPNYATILVYLDKKYCHIHGDSKYLESHIDISQIYMSQVYSDSNVKNLIYRMINVRSDSNDFVYYSNQKSLQLPISKSRSYVVSNGTGLSYHKEAEPFMLSNRCAYTHWTKLISLNIQE